MSDRNTTNIYVALLRGINVGGHKKVPMAELKKILGKIGFSNISTLLNSGNVVFQYLQEEPAKLEEKIAAALEKSFGFPVPVLVRKSENILDLAEARPFEGVDVHKDTRLYVTFFRNLPDPLPSLPWSTEDNSFRILQIKEKAVCSVLDLSRTKTTDSMMVLEKLFGKDITTRNWNTVKKICGMVDN